MVVLSIVVMIRKHIYFYNGPIMGLVPLRPKNLIKNNYIEENGALWPRSYISSLISIMKTNIQQNAYACLNLF